jgi:hypothetical protein
MRLPAGYEKMTDEELKAALLKTYENEETAQLVLDVVRGRVEVEPPLE